MRHTLLIIVLLLIGCKDKAVEPVDPLVGKWVLSETRFPGFEAIFGGTDIALGFFDNLRSVEFREDGSWEDNVGDKGTWTTENNKLTMTQPSGNKFVWSFEVSDSKLNLMMTGVYFIENMRSAGEDISEIQQMLNNSLETVLIVVVFERNGS